MLRRVLAVCFGLLVALAYGTGDFLGGRASRSSSTPGVLLVSQGSAAIGAVIVTLAVSADVAGRDLLFGGMAGVGNVVALALLYQGLSSGRMGLVAPVTAVVAAIFPITWGIAQGERPSVFVLIGAAGAVVAATLISVATGADRGGGDRRSLLMAIGAGAGFGTSFILFAKTSHDSGNWPVLAARVSAVTIVAVGVIVLSSRGQVSFPRGHDRILALGAGALDVSATTLLLLAVRHGLIVVVAPVAALAPAITVVLAWLVLKEHMGRLQLIGLLVALPALVLIAAG